MARSLQMLLPSQQALGMLSGGLQRLEAQVREDSLQARQAALATAEAKAVAQVENFEHPLAFFSSIIAFPICKGFRYVHRISLWACFCGQVFK